jgi:hypothetical protein
MHQNTSNDKGRVTVIYYYHIPSPSPSIFITIKLIHSSHLSNNPTSQSWNVLAEGGNIKELLRRLASISRIASAGKASSSTPSFSINSPAFLQSTFLQKTFIASVQSVVSFEPCKDPFCTVAKEEGVEVFVLETRNHVANTQTCKESESSDGFDVIRKRECI